MLSKTKNTNLALRREYTIHNTYTQHISLASTHNNESAMKTNSSHFKTLQYYLIGKESHMFEHFHFAYVKKIKTVLSYGLCTYD